jgi:cation:H+ antiporter
MFYITFCLGLALLVGGGELLVHSGVKLAKQLHLSPMIIGIVLMGCGTSLPELSASLGALYSNPPAPGMAFGNIIGSNISNILFILGISAFISPMRINKQGFKRDGLFLIMSVLMLALVMGYGYLDAIIGLFFILFILGYFVICYDKEPEPENLHLTKKKEHSVLMLSVLSVAAIVSIVYGAQLLVSSASGLARAWGVSKSILGLTLIAFGTSLPELTVSTVAAIHKHSSIAYGNIIGSNISNIFLIIGVMGVVHSTPIPPMWHSFWIMATATFAMVACGIYGKIPRWMGALLLIGYGFYVFSLF